MADPTPTPAPAATGTMGLRGLLWTNIGNASAMGLLGVVFFMQSLNSQDGAREDRALFRQVQQDNDRRFEKLADRIDQNTAVMTRAVERLDQAHQRVAEDVRRLKADVAGPIPSPREKEQ